MRAEHLIAIVLIVKVPYLLECSLKTHFADASFQCHNTSMLIMPVETPRFEHVPDSTVKYVFMSAFDQLCDYFSRLLRIKRSLRVGFRFKDLYLTRLIFIILPVVCYFLLVISDCNHFLIDLTIKILSIIQT